MTDKTAPEQEAPLTDAQKKAFDEFIDSPFRPFGHTDSMYNVAWRTWQAALASSPQPKAEQEAPLTDEQIAERIKRDDIAWLPIHSVDEAVGFVRWAMTLAPQPKGTRPLTDEQAEMVEALIAPYRTLDYIKTNEDLEAYVQERILLSASLSPAPSITPALRDVAAERRRQIEKEGWTPEHDDAHKDGAMGFAAAAYAIFGRNPGEWVVKSLWEWTGWAKHWWKPGTPRRNLVKAGALILAEIERLDRIDRPAPDASSTVAPADARGAGWNCTGPQDGGVGVCRTTS